MAFDSGSLLQASTGDAAHSEPQPPFAQLVSQLFFRSDASQRAGIVNQLLSNVSPEMLISLAGSIGEFLNRGAQPQVTPEQADQITPAQVEEIAATAEQHNPGVVDKIVSFYTHQPELVKTLDGSALGSELNKLAESHP